MSDGLSLKLPGLSQLEERANNNPLYSRVGQFPSSFEQSRRAENQALLSEPRDFSPGPKSASRHYVPRDLHVRVPDNRTFRSPSDSMPLRLQFILVRFWRHSHSVTALLRSESGL